VGWAEINKGAGDRRILLLSNSSGRWSLFDCGANTAAPVAEFAFGASPLSGRSGKEAGSRPSCGLVLWNLLFQVGYPKWGITYSPFTTSGSLRIGKQSSLPIHNHYAPADCCCQALFPDASLS